MPTNSKKVYDECLGFDLDNRQGEVIHETTLKGSKWDGVDLRDSSAIFQNGGLKVRKLEEKDQYLLAKWLSDPSVLEFYEGRDNPFTIDNVKEKFFNRRDGVMGCIVEYDGIEIGYIQYYPLDDEVKKEYGYIDEKIFGLDQFIGEGEFRNKGIGTLLVISMVHFLIEGKKADRVVMDPQTRNTRALKCYEKCGFKKVKILPNHELHEGDYQDCWLIEYQK